MGLLYVMSKFECLEHSRKAHSLAVANVCKSMASELKVYESFAYLGGLYHDIGYTINKANHPHHGYRILKNNKLDDIAIIALAHSRSENLDELARKELLKKNISAELKLYIDLVSTADFLVDGNGEVVGVEARLLDIKNRLGENSKSAIVAEAQRKDAIDWLNKNNLTSFLTGTS